MHPIDAHTKVFALIGHPLAHSLSPRMHNAAFRAAGINAVYMAFDTVALKEAVAGLKALGVRGASVTLPFKREVMSYLDQIEPMAKEIGAVNTLVNEGGKLVGYNTDATGALQAIEEVTDPAGAQCMIIGAGGAARAIGFALKHKGCTLTIINRSRQRGESLAAALEAAYIPLGQLTNVETNILIQTTPVGMHPETDKLPVDPQKIRADVVMDIIYNPWKTEFLRRFRAKGAKIIPGSRMFLYQGAEQFRLWTGLEPPLDVMEAAITPQHLAKS